MVAMGVLGQIAKLLFFVAAPLVLVVPMIVGIAANARRASSVRDAADWRRTHKRAVLWSAVALAAGALLAVVWLGSAALDPNFRGISGSALLLAAMVGIPLAFLVVLSAGIVSALRAATRTRRIGVDGAPDAGQSRARRT